MINVATTENFQTVLDPSCNIQPFSFGAVFFFQSDSAGVKVPELELELAGGTLGGIVTTVEGLIVKICEGRFASFYSPIHPLLVTKMVCTCLLKLTRGSEWNMCFCFLPFVGFTALERIHGFQFGDSTLEWEKKKWDDFKDRLSKVIFRFLDSFVRKVLS